MGAGVGACTWVLLASGEGGCTSIALEASSVSVQSIECVLNGLNIHSLMNCIRSFTAGMCCEPFLKEEEAEAGPHNPL